MCLGCIRWWLKPKIPSALADPSLNKKLIEISFVPAAQDWSLFEMASFVQRQAAVNGKVRVPEMELR
jgi:hypothetical protein